MAVPIKGFGSRLFCAMDFSGAATNSGTLRKTPRRSRLTVRSRKKRPTLLSQGVLGDVPAKANAFPQLPGKARIIGD